MGLSEWSEQHRHDAGFGQYRIVGDKLKRGFTSWPIAECAAQVDLGQNIQPRITATRVLLTGVFALALKKGRNKVYLAIEVPGDAILVELKAKDEGKARKFAAKVNVAAEHARGRTVSAGDVVDAVVIEQVEQPAALSAPPPSVPAGWYPAGDVQRYWDGAGWTNETAPLAP
ncbi:DUF2510 domain-containing protein [Nocardioides alkalitolerans]|uniref:DUF2510 domain-containing protein n=1 Tax=Nocardioides alkalitolerans TaxID=281714 RepID=UPI0004150FAF|nr:DUF2510 domain-containing protein [Nocardioides alkalitolerans]